MTDFTKLDRKAIQEAEESLTIAERQAWSEVSPTLSELMERTLERMRREFNAWYYQ